ncbi:MAG: alpha/beta hydrolase, partial [Cytophagaceae bacterium]|nr:alpha/beta hydrolase [Cytophagaceae bacterium]
DCAAAVSWVYENIKTHKGNPQRVYVCGHSAGGHLSALISLNKSYLLKISPVTSIIRGCILIDTFGLNIDYVMFNNASFFVKELEKVFSKDPEKWRKAAPVNYIKESNNIPFLIFTGEDTYPYLKMDNMIFMMNLEEHKVPFKEKKIPHRNHREMITELHHAQDVMYDHICKFISENIYQKSES